jgi:hypothetical protein
MQPKFIAVLVLFCFTGGLVSAATVEATPNFWTEFDVTFWQTVPFAAFWGYVAASQLARGGAVDWAPIVSFTLAISAVNAALHARRLTNPSRVVK